MTTQLTPGPTPPTSATPRDARRLPGASGHWWVYLILTIGLVAMLAPIIWMLLSSLKPNEEIRRTPPTWLPEDPSFRNFVDLFARLDMPTFIGNSVLVGVATTVGNVLFCSMVGYALAKIEFRGRNVLFGLVIGMLMVPAVVTFVPLFVLVSNLGLVNTYPGLIMPYLILPLGVFLMRQFIGGLPDELIDAARVDGAGELRIFARIVLPLCGPALATLSILTFLTSWNNFLWPLVVAQSEDKYTLPVAIALYTIDQNSSNFGLLLAGAVVVVMPIVLVFLVLQRYFVQGIATTGIK
jgi:multiple sugar transport system permease protein